MELLNKSMNEVVRNEALLLMIELTKDRKDGKLSKQIQKMVGFHSAFEKVLDIIQEEGKDAPRTHHCTHHCTRGCTQLRPSSTSGLIDADGPFTLP